jgi:hypothetical protein
LAKPSTRTAATVAESDVPDGETGTGMLDYLFPLRSGQVAKLRLLQRLDKDEPTAS